jgi:hypothetical protein
MFILLIIALSWTLFLLFRKKSNKI